ncbi:PhzF family phenazine biosynthesis protein [Modestobacter versicolor]|uniref:Isomerase n=1 Tax=Modestobacter versicolor TaxID=429133 RepID=A0A323VD50_9ACTN|nr:PhzF family phenazine biosynthesis protein [Modestobacter versicolor]MBB3677056.1 PhzF family phenazine biosynthesis protein [Modestobacter versicolor]PZA22635.1 isomerase [Modestobacter versicolor]
MQVPVLQLDAFATSRFAGNPAAVVVLPAFPDDAVLQAVAAANALPETAFVVPSGDRYRLRWFTPTVEVPLCGHATLAAGAVVCERLEPGRRRVVFDTASGPLTVDREGAGYRIDLPVRTVRPVPLQPALAAALGVTPLETFVDGGNHLALLPRAADVRALAPDLAAIARLDRTGVVVTAAGDGEHDFVSRYFAPAKGIPEDPVTGGAHCALVPFWAARTGRDTFLAHQASPRGGELTCRLVGDRVHLHGACVLRREGSIEL